MHLQWVQPFSCECRDGPDILIQDFQGFANFACQGPAFWFVYLVQDNELRLLCQPRIKQLQFPVDNPVWSKKILWWQGCNINQVEQKPGSFYVFKESCSQTHSTVRPFNEARNIGDDKRLCLVGFNHSQRRCQSGKRIVSDLGTG